jgi:RNA polymerase sigma-70 factor, ECF subfamily
MTLATDVDVWREDPTGAAASTHPLALPASAGFAWGVTRRSSRAIGDAVTGDPGAPSDDWVYRLSHAGPDRDAAIAALHALLLRAARFEVNRRGAVFPNLHGADLDDLACQSADDAMMSILRRLADFRGESRFTTWACKFALVEAGAKVRRHAWRGREIPVTAESLSADADNAPLPDAHAEAQMLLIAVREEVKQQLTARQREAFVAVALNEVPIDVVADRLNTTRGAVYKTLHDARRKLRMALNARGLGIEGERA